MGALQKASRGCDGEDRPADEAGSERGLVTRQACPAAAQLISGDRNDHEQLTEHHPGYPRQEAKVGHPCADHRSEFDVAETLIGVQSGHTRVCSSREIDILPLPGRAPPSKAIHRRRKCGKDLVIFSKLTQEHYSEVPGR